MHSCKRRNEDLRQNKPIFLASMGLLFRRIPAVKEILFQNYYHLSLQWLEQPRRFFFSLDDKARKSLRELLWSIKPYSFALRLLLLVDVLFWRVREYLPSGSPFSPKVVFVLQLGTVQEKYMMWNCSRIKSVDKSTAFIIFKIRNFTLVRLFVTFCTLGGSRLSWWNVLGFLILRLRKKGVAFQNWVSSILSQRSSFRSFEAEHPSADSANLFLF